MKTSANVEIIKSIKMNRHLYGQQSSDPWKPISFVLVSEFYYGIVHKEKAVHGLHYDNLPSAKIHIYISIYAYYCM